jgi:RNA polymerase sigma-70 factor (ECF subfamily)
VSVTTELLDRARSGNELAFRELVDPFRGDLQLHCYRILGSIHDAEDAVQDTLLGAWQSLGSFEGRSSIRTWLRRIATNRCLNKLRAESRRLKPDTTSMPDLPEPTRLGEVPWLEPYPDSLLEGLADPAPGPEVRYQQKEAISLAFVTALQLLPPRQRAVLILRDVLGYHASEVAQILDSSEESVTSALKRARATLQQRLPQAGKADLSPSPRSTAEFKLVERFAEAYASRDVDAVVGLLTEDVWFAMPPVPYEWQGHRQMRQFLAAIWTGPRAERRLISTRANGQPAFALYLPDPHGNVMHATGLLVLTLAGDRISAMTRFDNSVLRYFDLPRTLPTDFMGRSEQTIKWYQQKM